VASQIFNTEKAFNHVIQTGRRGRCRWSCSTLNQALFHVPSIETVAQGSVETAESMGEKLAVLQDHREVCIEEE